MPFRDPIDFILSFCTLQISTYPRKTKGSQNLAGAASFSPQPLQGHSEAIGCNFFYSKSPINFPSHCSLPTARVQEICFLMSWSNLLEINSCAPKDLGSQVIQMASRFEGTTQIYIPLCVCYVCIKLVCSCAGRLTQSGSRGWTKFFTPTYVSISV